MKKLVLCLCLLPSLGFPGDDREIVPGARIGAINLGFTRDQVQSLLGKPKSVTGDGEAFESLSVKYDRQGRVAEISTWDETFSTSKGISVTTPQSEFATTYFVRFKLCKDVPGAPEGKGGAILDSIDNGIAMESSMTQGERASMTTALTVHQRKYALTNRGKVRVCD